MALAKTCADTCLTSHVPHLAATADAKRNMVCFNGSECPEMVHTLQRSQDLRGKFNIRIAEKAKILSATQTHPIFWARKRWWVLRVHSDIAFFVMSPPRRMDTARLRSILIIVCKALDLA